MQLVSLLQYMCATLTQLYIYCSYGDVVYNEVNCVLQFIQLNKLLYNFNYVTVLSIRICSVDG